jgi:cytochrome P450
VDTFESTLYTVYYVVQAYDHPGSLLTLPPAEHSKRRRLWDRAFTPGSLASYTPLLHYRVSELIHNLSVRSGNNRQVDLAEWLSFMALDFMGDFAYGSVFHFMRDGEDLTGFKRMVEDGVGFTELIGAMPWVRPIFVALPTPTHTLFEAAHTVGQRRKQRGTTVKDLFYYILGEDGRGDPTEPQMTADTLAQEATLATVAGSDTTGTALSNAMFYLLTNPVAFDRLSAEVDSITKENEDQEAPLDSTRLAELPFLQAVMCVFRFFISHSAL